VTALPPDPDPENAPGVELGGGVAPGDTPPDSAQTSATSNPDPPIHRRMTPTSIVTVVAIGLFVLLFAATAVLLALKIMGVFG
jgi:Family of unknown function (DUF6480)